VCCPYNTRSLDGSYHFEVWGAGKRGSALHRELVTDRPNSTLAAAHGARLGNYPCSRATQWRWCLPCITRLTNCISQIFVRAVLPPWIIPCISSHNLGLAMRPSACSALLPKRFQFAAYDHVEADYAGDDGL
jgi:hypothetical protein